MSAPALPPNLQALLETPGLASLDGHARPGTLGQAALTQQVQAACRSGVIAEEGKQLVLAAVLLWHDRFDAAHQIAQEIEGPHGSLLHGIVHRREPDFSNAKYWFRRAGQHVCYAGLAKAVLELVSRDSALITSLVPNGNWDPFGFVDACANVAASPGNGDRRKLLQEIQYLEFCSFLASLTAGR